VAVARECGVLRSVTDPYTPSTLTDPALLRREQERIRDVGRD
jgi:hypothetical protein